MEKKLKKYLSKRDLAQTPEPKGKVKKSKKDLRFVVQKHAARRLHYDFRLECNGVLLSWAIPKGPSMDPKDKRLAVHVEDHPLDYQYFEGVIPKGNYGAGTVEIWDAGTYTVPGTESRQEAEEKMEAGLKKGHLMFTLDGEKLQGLFALVDLRRDNSWILIKQKDSDSKETKPKKKSSKMPSWIAPMLAKLIKEPFNDEDWLFEIKWDGYRCLAFINHGVVQLKSRSNKSFNAQFPKIVASLKKVRGEVILDGEVVVLDENGKPQFYLMQNYQGTGKGDLCYYVFDMLFRDGEDLRERPLLERKKLLKDFLTSIEAPLVYFSDHVIGKGKDFFKEATKLQLEGIMGKNSESVYQSTRSGDWVKIKTKKRQEVIIGGFTAPRGSRKRFGALLAGVYHGDDLIYVANVGGGFTDQLLEEVYKKLKPLIRPTSPFKKIPKTDTPATWVEPKLVAEVDFAEWTKDRNLRQPIFQGLREDKPPQQVSQEVPEEKFNPHKKNEDYTNLDKVYWSKEKCTKGDLIEYYRQISPYILPYLKDRPIVLHRFPEGIHGEDFYQKDLTVYPKWIETYPLKHDNKMVHYLKIKDERSLLYAVNLGSIDIHPFLARIQNLDNPDFCVLDLDPQNLPFDKAIETALVMHEVLESIGVKHFCKTSGGRGLHIYIPFHAKYDFEQSRQFAEIIAIAVHQKLPKITSLERNPKKRPKLVYLDYLQNRIGQTIVAPYSIRPRPHVSVSTPVTWKELEKGVDPTQFDINTIPPRLKKLGDIFKPVLSSSINLSKSLKKLKEFL